MKRPNRRGLVLSIVFFLLLAAPAFPEGPVQETKSAAEAGRQEKNRPPDPNKVVAARVNGVVISLEAIMKSADSLAGNKAAGKDAAGDRERFKKDALNKLITQELALQKARAEGMKADGARVEEAMGRLKEKLGGDEGYRMFLTLGNLSEDSLRAELERALVIDTIYAREVTEGVTVSEEDAKKEYEREKEKFRMPEKVSVTDVVFFLPLDKEDSIGKVGKVLAEITENKAQDPFKATPADFFVVRDIDLAPDGALYEAAKKLQVGQLSGVVRTSDSYHIIKLKVFKPFKQYSFEEVKGIIMKKLAAEARQKRFKEWEADLRKDAKIEILLPDTAKDSEKK